MNPFTKHQLIFEDAWERTISSQDRDEMWQLIQSSPLPLKETVRYLPFRLAINHRGDVLATVLIQNFTNKNFTIENLTLQWTVIQEILGVETFSFPHVLIKPNSSTPWTFIFPQEKLSSINQVNIPEQVKELGLKKFVWRLEKI